MPNVRVNRWGLVVASVLLVACNSSDESTFDARIVIIDAAPHAIDSAPHAVDAASPAIDAPVSVGTPDQSQSGFVITRNEQGIAALTVTVRDSSGSALAGISVSLANSVATFSPQPSSGVTDQHGIFAATLTAPIPDDPTGITPTEVTATIGTNAFTVAADVQFGVVTTTVAGDGGASDANGAPGTGELSSPSGLAIDSAGTIYVLENKGCAIRKVDTGGNITTLVSPSDCDTGAIAIGPDDTLYAAISQSKTSTITTFDNQGNQTPVAGGAAFQEILAIAVDGNGNIYVGDELFTISVIDTTGNVTVLSGNGTSGNLDGTGGATGTAEFACPSGLALDGTGNVFVADECNCNIREIDSDGNATTIAGNVKCGFVDGDGGATGPAEFSAPAAIAIGSNGDLFVADTGNCAIRAIDSAGEVTTIGRTGTCGFADGPRADVGEVNSIVTDHDGDLDIADTSNNRIRRISSPVRASSLSSDVNAVDADGTSTATLTLALVDTAGIPVADQLVTMSSTGNNNSFAPASGHTDDDGVFTATMSSTEPGSKIVSAAEQSTTVTFLPWKLVGTLENYSPVWTAAVGNSIYLVTGNAQFGGLSEAKAFDVTTNTFSDIAYDAGGSDFFCVCGYQSPLVGANGKIWGFDEDAVEYDPSTNSWSQPSSYPHADGEWGVAAIDNLLYFVGGRADSTSLRIFDTNLGAWSFGMSSPISVYSPVLAEFGGDIYMLGGDSTGSTVNVYSPNTNTWTARNPAPFSFVVTYVTTQAQAVGSVFYVGGQDNISGDSGVYTYDSSADSWSLFTALPPDDTAPATLLIANGIMYLVGTNSSNTTEIWQFVTPP